MLSTDGFKEFAGKVVLFLHNTSKIESDPHPNLLREKGFNAYPTVAFMDHTGRVLFQQPPDQRDVAGLERTLSRLEEWRRLGASDDPKLKKRLFLIEMDFGMLTFAEARKALEKLGGELTAGEQKGIDPKMVELEFVSILKTIHISRPETLEKAGQKFVTMLEADRIPRSEQRTTFWQGALTYAFARRDADQFEKIMNRAKKELAGDFRLERYMQWAESRLQQLRKSKRQGL